MFVYFIDGCQSFGGDDCGWGVVVEQLVCFEYQYVVGVMQGNIDVVYYYQGYDVVLLGFLVYQIYYVKLVVEVKGVEWFVEQQQVWLVDQ